jgi:predicted GNAT family acetyltransferase
MTPWRRSADTGSRLGIRTLQPADRASALELCLRDPVGSVLAGGYVETLGIHPVQEQLLGVFDGPSLVAICWAGANLVPVAAGPEAVAAIADAQRGRGRRCSSIVGPAEAVLGLWELLRPAWSPAREVRDNQPSLAITGAPLVEPDPLVRRSVPADFDILFPACVAMFTEEVGYSPTVAGASYEARVRELVERGRSFVRIDEGPDGAPRVVFKAELGAVALGVAQVQGVWVPPDMRGRGLAKTGMAAVVRAALHDVAPTVSLYVNGYNRPALAVYERVGFRQVGTYATVLF